MPYTLPMTDINTLEGAELLSALGGAHSTPSRDSDSVSAPEVRTQRQGAPSTTEERALELLGGGISAEQAAAALGVSAARISQLLAQPTFAAKVEEMRYNAMQKHNARDESYDKIEDTLIDKLVSSMPMMIRPADILRAITVINGAKRRGQSAPEQVSANTTIVSLLLPTQITQKFTTNTFNQVVSAGDQDLVTIQASALLKASKSRSEASPSTPTNRSNTQESTNVQIQDTRGTAVR